MKEEEEIDYGEEDEGIVNIGSIKPNSVLLPIVIYSEL